MKAEILSKFDQPWLPVTAQLLFLTVFIGVIIYAYKKSNQATFFKQAALPLEEESTHEQ